MGVSKSLKMLPILAMLVAAVAVATMEEDEKDCADQLANLAACIPYVSGTAKKPTPQCCQDTQKVKSAKPKCLCVLIKESTDPSMGLPVNTTLALQMPSQCNIDAKISDCPTLLNLSPDSPDAKIFKSGSSTSSTTDAQPTPVSASSGTSSSSSETGSGLVSKATPTSNGVAEMSGSLLAMTGLTLLAWLLI
ncbi:non-specific lipid transfer protein GPI-anchored 14-like [Actinidia eriantha]|uniref:non-specific lipid transfer protein GPI-anchored 14-like n=1 Tax=Actinidia eriantha TaxID=165200 RepID=UPI00258387A9|nr:non-specific lipid transfer protein GPI-anchored 14-like [Actinidia eriantha]